MFKFLKKTFNVLLIFIIILSFCFGMAFAGNYSKRPIKKTNLQQIFNNESNNYKNINEHFNIIKNKYNIVINNNINTLYNNSIYTYVINHKIPNLEFGLPLNNLFIKFNEDSYLNNVGEFGSKKIFPFVKCGAILSFNYAPILFNFDGIFDISIKKFFSFYDPDSIENNSNYLVFKKTFTNLSNSLNLFYNIDMNNFVTFGGEVNYLNITPSLKNMDFINNYKSFQYYATFGNIYKFPLSITIGNINLPIINMKDYFYSTDSLNNFLNNNKLYSLIGSLSFVGNNNYFHMSAFSCSNTEIRMPFIIKDFNSINKNSIINNVANGLTAIYSHFGKNINFDIYGSFIHNLNNINILSKSIFDNNNMLMKCGINLGLYNLINYSGCITILSPEFNCIKEAAYSITKIKNVFPLKDNIDKIMNTNVIIENIIKYNLFPNYFKNIPLNIELKYLNKLSLLSKDDNYGKIWYSDTSSLSGKPNNLYCDYSMENIFGITTYIEKNVVIDVEFKHLISYQNINKAENIFGNATISFNTKFIL